MNEEEFKQFKEILESEFVYDVLRKATGLEKNAVLARIINFLNFTKEYNCDSLRKWLEESLGVLPIAYIQEKKNLTSQEINCFLFESFKKTGYFYHVTNPKYLTSILEKGLLSLNTRFQRDVYRDCKNLNVCWDQITKENQLSERKDLAIIPFYNILYPERFNSVYLSSNLYAALRIYAMGHELFTSIMDNLSSQLLIQKDSVSTKYEFLQQLSIRMNDKSFHIKSEQKQFLFDFCNCYYKDISFVNDFSEQAIVMVPMQRIIPILSLSNRTLFKSKRDFSVEWSSYTDVECDPISKEGLIGIVKNKDDSIKVYRKSK